MSLFVVAVFVSAFLLFSVQPMVAKFILPAFGGTAAVWATCMVVFQTLLLAGYAYAHLLRVRLSPMRQRWVHLTLLAGALLFLPPVPHVNAAAAIAHPVWELLRSVMTSVGVPFFALAATAPLLMEWFRQTFPTRTPDRLYAFSNAGSLLALISYPALIEPDLGSKMQARCWGAGMVIFLLICGVTAWWSEKRSKPSTTHPTLSPVEAERASNRRSAPLWLWVALSACGSALLLALTNQITQDVAPMPLLWVAPLGVYLLTFVLCFESTRFYRRWLFMPVCFVLFLLLAWLLREGYRQGFWLQVAWYLAVLFSGCMLCHGELYRMRPPAERLTLFYLSLSTGGAIGGAFVALVAPVLFPMILETPIIVATVASLAVFILKREHFSWPYRISPIGLGLVGILCVLVSLGYALMDLRKDAILFTRNFYGVYRVKEGPWLKLDSVTYPLTPGVARILYSGQIYHGLQFTNIEASRIATTYYGEEGGLGLVFRALSGLTNRHIGAVGLGVGTLATYGRTGDRIRFYELNPAVLHLAETHFTFLTNCQARVSVILGDGRLSLGQEPAQHFDLLVLDAFAGDAIPMHLLTEEAMSIYRRHLKSDGVMAFHISNSHLNLEPVVRALAEQHGFRTLLLPPQYTDPQSGKLASMWMLLSANEAFFRRPEVAAMPNYSTQSPPILWTDDHASVLSILH